MDQVCRGTGKTGRHNKVWKRSGRVSGGFTRCLRKDGRREANEDDDGGEKPAELA